MRAMVGLGVDPATPLTVVLADGVARCAWVSTPVAGLVEYHDLTWGTPTRDPSAVFGALAEAIFEGGLSWATVFRKRAALQTAFHNFDPDAVAAMSTADIDQLRTNPDVIRNGRKIDAIVHDARLARGNPTLVEVAWVCRPSEHRPFRSWSAGPSGSGAAQKLSRRLTASGYRGVGPTTAHALLTTIGVVNHHVDGCFRAL
jgi:DNA-3-methyladenine glycosylase I